jgi:hypothetical protein
MESISSFDSVRSPPHTATFCSTSAASASGDDAVAVLIGEYELEGRRGIREGASAEGLHDEYPHPSSCRWGAPSPARGDVVVADHDCLEGLPSAIILLRKVGLWLVTPMWRGDALVLNLQQLFEYSPGLLHRLPTSVCDVVELVEVE